jgi:hypothetical protein
LFGEYILPPIIFVFSGSNTSNTGLIDFKLLLPGYIDLVMVAIPIVGWMNFSILI